MGDREASDGKARLGRIDWILAGYRALAQGGVSALRVEALARDIGTTKGSFYWHFKDAADLQQDMLETWEKLATTEITAAVKRSDLGPQEKLSLLIDMISILPGPQLGGSAIEPAIRDWGRTDPRARLVLERVDRQRLADLSEFLTAAGLDTDAVPEASRILYAAVIGLEHLRMTTGTDMRSALQAVSTALFKG
jgi:AcrR family transcriptional regulator